MERADQFLTTLNKIENYLREKTGDYEYKGIRRLLDQSSNVVLAVEKYRSDIIEFTQLRNAIVHKSTGEVIAEPHPKVVEYLEKIYQEIVSPRKIMVIAKSPVYIGQSGQSLKDIIEIMQTKYYTYIPINQSGKFVGVFSENTLVKYFADHSKNLDLAAVKVADVINYLDQNQDKHNAYEFVSEDFDVFQVEQAFTSFMREERRLGALFVTKDGEVSIDILGVVTAWDLAKIGERANGKTGEQDNGKIG